MDITTILIVICLTAILTIITLLILLIHSRKVNKELQEELQGTYFVRNVILTANRIRVKITYCIAYKNKHESKEEHINKIRSHLEINSYGSPDFNEKTLRDHLRNHGFRNVRITLT